MGKASLAALLIVGIALVPAGLYANYFLGDQIGAAVPEVLLTIKDEAEGQIEDELNIIGNGDALKRIMELAYEKLPEVINASATAQVINKTLDGVIDNVEFGAKCATAANIINQTLYGVVYQGLIGQGVINATTAANAIKAILDTLQNPAGYGQSAALARENFFNNESLTDFYPNLLSLKGLSEYINETLSLPGWGNLSFSPANQSTILYAPTFGLLDDLESGMGVLTFMSLWWNSTRSDFTPLQRATYQGMMQVIYGATWNQLNYTGIYIGDYLYVNGKAAILASQGYIGPTAEVDYAWDVAIDMYFNDAGWTEKTDGLTAPVLGISEYWNETAPYIGIGSLNYTALQTNWTLYGHFGIPGAGTGFLDDLAQGMGVATFLALYQNATNLDFTPGQRAGYQGTMEAIYGKFFATNITFLAGYINNFLFALVPTVFYGKYGMTTATYAYNTVLDWFFNSLSWTSLTQNKAPISGLSEVAVAYFGATGSLGISAAAQKKLLDGTVYSGIALPGLNYQMGLGMGVIAILDLYDNATDGLNGDDATLKGLMMAGYGLTSWYQVANWTMYLRNYIIPNVVPSVLLQTYQTNNFNNLVPMLVFQQWCNYTLTDGDQLNLRLLENELPGDCFGLEVNIPTLTNATCTALWDEDDDMAITTRDGQKMWYDAWDGGENSDEFKDLKDNFGLTTAETQGIADWLYEGDDSFQKQALPTLFLYDQGVDASRKATLLFLEQWADMTMDGDEEYPDGLPLGKDAAGKDITGIELGEKSDIKLSTAEDMWDEDNKLAFTNAQGITKWYAAADKSSAAYKELQDEFDLDDDQMKLVTDWLAKFKSATLPTLAEMQTGTNPSMLQSLLTWGLIVPGAILAVIGAIKLKKLK